MNAVFLVNANNHAALRTRPSFGLVSRKLPDAVFLDDLKIFDHAHGVFGPIPIIQVVQCSTGKTATIVAVLVFTFP